MPNTLLKIRLWTKLVLFVLVGLWAVLFLFNNTAGQLDVEVWYFPFVERFRSSPLFLMLLSFVLGGALTLLGRMLLFSGRQVRGIRAGDENAELRREIDRMRKASKPATGHEPAAGRKD